MHEIVPCGLEGRKVTCLNDACGKVFEISQIAVHLSHHIVKSLFGFDVTGNSFIDFHYLDEFFNDWTKYGNDSYFHQNEQNLWTNTVNSILIDLGSIESNVLLTSD